MLRYRDIKAFCFTKKIEKIKATDTELKQIENELKMKICLLTFAYLITLTKVRLGVEGR